MSELAKKKCIPCRVGTPPLKGEEIDNLYEQLDKGWVVVHEHHLKKKIYLS